MKNAFHFPPTMTQFLCIVWLYVHLLMQIIFLVRAVIYSIMYLTFWVHSHFYRVCCIYNFLYFCIYFILDFILRQFSAGEKMKNKKINKSYWILLLCWKIAVIFHIRILSLSLFISFSSTFASQWWDFWLPDFFCILS